MNIKKILTYGIVGITVAMVIFSGVMKLVGLQEAVKTLTAVGVGPYITYLGLMEIGFSILFVFAPTRKVGFTLLNCYFAGAIATDLSHGATILNPAMPLVMIWISALLLDKSILLPSTFSNK
ncbi:MAG: hypothetical protein RL642_534 [Bacteroidota bacterium]|jgi:hypothetical protein